MRKKLWFFVNFCKKFSTGFLASQHGKGTAITATARKLAVIVYKMIAKGEAYRPEPLAEYQQKVRAQKIKHIQRTIQKLEIKPSEVAFN